MKTKRTWLSLLLVAVMLACLAVPAFAADTDNDPYADVTPGKTNCAWNNLTKPSEQNTAGKDGNIEYYRTLVDKVIDYNGSAGGLKSQLQYTFSFSAKGEEGMPIAPLNFRERGFTTENVRYDIGILQINADGDIFATNFVTGGTVYIGSINTTTWTNITVSIDRTTYTATYFIDGVCVYNKTYDASWKLAGHATWTDINQNAGGLVPATVPRVILHGNYSRHTGAVTENDTAYFAKAFPDLQINHTKAGFTDVSGTVGDNLSLNYHFLLASDQTAAKVNMTRNGKSVTLTPVEVKDGQTLTYNGKTYTEYAVTYSDIGPQNMTDLIVAKIVLNDEVLASNTYSFQRYCLDLFAAYPDDSKVAGLVTSLLNYGAEAQKYLGYNTGVLPALGNVLVKQNFEGSYGTNAGGGEPGTVLRSCADGDDTVLQVKSGRNYYRFFLTAFYENAEIGKTYTMFFRFKLLSKKDGTPGSFQVGNGDVNSKESGGLNRNMDKVFATVTAKNLGEWEVAQFTFTYQPTKDTYDDFCISINGCGDAAGQILYEILFDDVMMCEVADTTSAAVPTEVNVKEVSDPATITGANVIFDTQNRIRFTISADALGEGVTVTLNGTPVTPGQGEDGKYYVETEALSPLAYNTVFTLKVGDVTAKYSLNSYAYRMQDNASIGALVRATYAYGVAAEAYKNAQ